MQAPGGLSDKCRIPLDIIFDGDDGQARVAAQEKRCWLILNVQSDNQLDSFSLNRDVWGAEAMKDVIMQNFIFCQVGMYEVAVQCSVYVETQLRGRNCLPSRGTLSIDGKKWQAPNLRANQSMQWLQLLFLTKTTNLNKFYTFSQVQVLS